MQKAFTNPEKSAIIRQEGRKDGEGASRKQKGYPMTVTAINSVNVGKYNNVSFGRREETPKPEQRPTVTSSLLKSVPLAALIAMSPMTTVDVNAQSSNNKASALTCDRDRCFNLPQFDKKNFRQAQVIEVNNGQKYNLYFESYNEIPKSVQLIRLFKCDSQGNIDRSQYSGGKDFSAWFPPTIRALIYHDLGEGKEFLGVRLSEEVYNTGGSPVGRKYYEVKIDDEKVGQYLIDLLTNDTKWINHTKINFEETKSKYLEPEKYVKFH